MCVCEKGGGGGGGGEVPTLKLPLLKHFRKR